MKLLLLGSKGQLGYELSRDLKTLSFIDVVTSSRDQVDLSQLDQVERYLDQISPDIIVNAAAYTAVDLAEKEVQQAELINAKLPELLSNYLTQKSGLLMHYSTDYVFNGEKGDAYIESDSIQPLSVYGKTKAEGEECIKRSGVKYIILRTSWVYASRGHNFIKTMMRLASEKESLSVVDDQISAPTWAGSLSQLSVQLLDKLFEKRQQSGVWEQGLYHACSKNHTSWHGLAVEALGMLRVSYGKNWVLKSEKDIKAISTQEFPLPAKRPLDSRMDCSLLRKEWGLEMPTWEEQLHQCFKGN